MAIESRRVAQYQIVSQLSGSCNNMTVQERGCEKSGKIACFATYLKDEFGITSIPLFPFLGNRFNILFVNAAGIYFLYDQLLDSFRRIERNNKLLDAVYWDLEILSFKIGCRALGLIEKLITGPLWKIMPSETQILRMSSHYENLLEFLESSSEDCSKFLRGESFCDPSFINREECLIKILEPCDEQTPLMTKQFLEIILGGLKMVTRRMLHVHLDDEKYAQVNNLDSDIWSQTESAATTNVKSERDFGVLDRLMKLKLKALDLTYEGNILYIRNKTNEWRKNLTPEELDKVLDFAKKSKSRQKASYFQNKKLIFEKKNKKLKESMEQKEKKEKMDSEERERLLRQLDDFGGLSDLDVVDAKLSKFSSEKEQRLPLKMQLSFWQNVIGVKCARTHFTLSSGGVMKPISKLLKNLKHVITWNSDTPDTDDIDFSKPYIISAAELHSVFKENAKNNSVPMQQNEAENVE